MRLLWEQQGPDFTAPLSFFFLFLRFLHRWQLAVTLPKQLLHNMSFIWWTAMLFTNFLSHSSLFWSFLHISLMLLQLLVGFTGFWVCFDSSNTWCFKPLFPIKYSGICFTNSLSVKTIYDNIPVFITTQRGDVMWCRVHLSERPGCTTDIMRWDPCVQLETGLNYWLQMHAQHSRFGSFGFVFSSVLLNSV